MLSLNRRRLIQGAGSLGAMSLMGARVSFAQGVQRLVIPSYGGNVEVGFRETFVAKFERETGIKVDIQLGGPSQWIAQVAASPNNPPLDAIVASSDVLYQIGQEGMLERPSVDLIPNLADIPQTILDASRGWGVPYGYATTGIAFHKDRVPNPPKSIREFIERTAAGEWVASLPSISYNGTPFWIIWSFLDILGGNLDDIDPVLAAVKSMQPNTIFWGGVTDFLNHLESGEADIGFFTDARTWAAYDSGLEWIGWLNPAEGGIMTQVGLGKPKNTPDEVWKFLDCVLDPVAQAQFAEMTSSGVPNPKAQLSDLIKQRITPSELTRTPPVEIASHLTQWVEAWNKEIGA